MRALQARLEDEVVARYDVRWSARPVSHRTESSLQTKSAA
jgi:hypothetical protein